MAAKSISRSLSIKCAALYAVYYVLMYTIGIMTSTYLLNYGFPSEAVATMLSVSGFITLVCKPFFAGFIDKGHCKPLVVLYVALIGAGTFVFFGTAEKSYVHAILWAIMAQGFTFMSAELTDSWCLKLIKEYGGIDYGKARSFGSISYAITAAAYGVAITNMGYQVAPYVIYTALAIMLVLALTLPNPSAMEGYKPTLREKFSVLTNSRFLTMVIFCAIGNATTMLLDSYIPVLITERGGTATQVGLSSFVMAGLEFIMLMFFTKIANFVGTDNVLSIGMLGFALKAVLVSIMPTPNMIIIACATQVFGFCMFLPGRMRFIEEEIDQRHIASAMTVNGMISSIVSTFISNPLAGSLTKSVGTARMLQVFACTAAFAGIGFAIAIRAVSGGRKRCQLRFFFEWGTDNCLWAKNVAAFKRFGAGEISYEELGLSRRLSDDIRALAAEMQPALDRYADPEEVMWAKYSREDLARQAKEICRRISEELGRKYQVIYDFDWFYGE